MSNTALSGGGGLSTDRSSIELIDNLIQGNQAGQVGAGLALDTAAEIINNQILSNTIVNEPNRRGQGAGIYVVLARPHIVNNVIAGNTGTGYLEGGGIFAEPIGLALISNTISGNTATVGGGLHLFGPVHLDRNVISNNAAEFGAGLYLVDYSQAILTNTVLVQNKLTTTTLMIGPLAGRPHAGSAIFMPTAGLHLAYTTIAANNADAGDGSAISSGGFRGFVYMTNTILVSHTVGLSLSQLSSVELNASLLGNKVDFAGFGNVVSTSTVFGAPNFVDPAQGDYHLGLGSAAIDRGIDVGVAVDIEGNSRPQSGGYDLGPYERVKPVVFSAFLRLPVIYR